MNLEVFHLILGSWIPSCSHKNTSLKLETEDVHKGCEGNPLRVLASFLVSGVILIGQGMTLFILPATCMYV